MLSVNSMYNILFMANIKHSLIIVMFALLPSCATTMAVVDVAGSTVVYTGKTIVNTVDTITPDIVNK